MALADSWGTWDPFFRQTQPAQVGRVGHLTEAPHRLCVETCQTIPKSTYLNPEARALRLDETETPHVSFLDASNLQVQNPCELLTSKNEICGTCETGDPERVHQQHLPFKHDDLLEVWYISILLCTYISYKLYVYIESYVGFNYILYIYPFHPKSFLQNPNLDQFFAIHARTMHTPTTGTFPLPFLGSTNAGSLKALSCSSLGPAPKASCRKVWLLKLQNGQFKGCDNCGQDFQTNQWTYIFHS